ncbi:subtilisin-like protease [Exidia glandulosa HHB12029]|uniref:Subtilisin-like protease n=1 Tax=Exidia glandulosa HHB12029 TaxID=1314781 RepID=A0A165G5G7_EXIGL|nr:subtilisin-like protease [Exidia glandulosa HHB12029]
MRSFTLVAAVATTAVVAVTPLSSVHRQNTLPALTGKVIVELKPSTSTNSFIDAHAAFFEHLDRRGVEWVTNSKFDSDVFTGVSVTLANPEDIAHLESLDSVKSVRPVRPFDRPRVIGKHVLSGPKDANAPAGDSDSTHKMTGVDKLHAAGIFGKGIKIGIIDSGVDYTHPNLGGKFGPGNLIAGGTDFVGDAFDGTNTPVPDNDPLDQCGGHGTHVAGIIAAQPGNEFNISGVAYEAELRSYRIFGCPEGGTTTDDIIVEALIRAYNEGNDVITLSLGGADGWTESAGSVVASRIASKGKVVTIAAGNAGEYGAWYSSSPGNGLDVISVASVDNTEAVYQSLKISGAERAPVAYLTDGSIHPINITGEWPIYALSKDSSVTDDACNALPDSTPDLSKYITIIRRGTCNFSQKLANAAAKGAKYAIVYNNGGAFAPVVFGNDTQAVLIQSEDGAFLVDQFSKGVDVKISFPQSGAVLREASATGGLVSDFTSFGPSNDMYFKPAVAAPGGNIVNTWPVKLGSFVSISGTSMATPHTAGAAALILQAKGKSAALAKNMRTLLETTAQTIASDKEDGAAPQTLSQQGAGLINVYNAINYKTSVSPGELLLNDTANWKTFHTITVTNNGDKKQTYRLSHVPAGTALTLQKGFPLPKDYPVPLTADKVTVHLSAQAVTLEAGKSATVQVGFTPPKDIAKEQLPVLSGFIQIVGGGETLHVSYLGLAASLKEAAVIDGSTLYFGTRTPLLMNKDMEEQTTPTVYTLNDTDAPTLLFRMAMGTPSLVIDLVPADTHIHVTLNPPKNFAPTNKFATGSFDAVKTVGRVGDIPYMSRDNDSQDTGYSSITLPTTFANGTAVPPGNYRLLLRALKITGNPTKQEDYETYLSPSFTIKA